jgi:hypothetical protein
MNKTIEEQHSLVCNFIFSKLIQSKFNEILNRENHINLLEITGMGTQEIKHSNVLSWLFSDEKHGLNNWILFEFLKVVFKENNNVLRYLNLRKEGVINIYREKVEGDVQIDILIEDIENSRIFIIENKIHDRERKGQLESYEKAVNRIYKNTNCQKHFIFLSPKQKPPTRNIWAKADYNMLYPILIEALDRYVKSEKVRFIIKSYIDLLKKEKIMKNEELKNICEEIWFKKENREALEILVKNKPDFDPRLIKIGEKYGTPLTLIRKYNNKTFEIILKSDGLLYLDGKAYLSPSRLYNYGIVGNKGKSSGRNDLDQFIIKNTGEKLPKKI